MKKLFLAGVVLLSGCSVSQPDPILGHWREETKVCDGKTFCAFTVAKGKGSDYTIRFDVVPKGFPNTGIIKPNWKDTEGVYLYTAPNVSKGVMMYLDNGTLVETNRGTRFKKDL